MPTPFHRPHVPTRSFPCCPTCSLICATGMLSVPSCTDDGDRDAARGHTLPRDSAWAVAAARESLVVRQIADSSRDEMGFTRESDGFVIVFGSSRLPNAEGGRVSVRVRPSGAVDLLHADR